MEFSWKPAQQTEREFIIKTEYELFKKRVFLICLTSGLILIFIYIFVHMSAAASYEQIKYKTKTRSNQHEVSENAYGVLVLGADHVSDYDGSMQPMNLLPKQNTDLISARRYYFSSCLFLLSLCAAVSSWLIYGQYKDYNAFRKLDIDVCYGRCTGKEYVSIRYNLSYRSHYSVSLYLSDGTLLENVEVSEPLCKNVKLGDPLLLANISGPCQGPDKNDEIDGIYLLEKHQSTEL